MDLALCEPSLVWLALSVMRIKPTRLLSSSSVNSVNSRSASPMRSKTDKTDNAGPGGDAGSGLALKLVILKVRSFWENLSRESLSLTVV